MRARRPGFGHTQTPLEIQARGGGDENSKTETVPLVWTRLTGWGLAASWCRVVSFPIGVSKQKQKTTPAVSCCPLTALRTRPNLLPPRVERGGVERGFGRNTGRIRCGSSDFGSSFGPKSGPAVKLFILYYSPSSDFHRLAFECCRCLVRCVADVVRLCSWNVNLWLEIAIIFYISYTVAYSLVSSLISSLIYSLILSLGWNIKLYINIDI